MRVAISWRCLAISTLACNRFSMVVIGAALPEYRGTHRASCAAESGYNREECSSTHHSGEPRRRRGVAGSRASRIGAMYTPNGLDGCDLGDHVGSGEPALARLLNRGLSDWHVDPLLQ